MTEFKTLLVMRHAKSSWDSPGLSDFERPLNGRGKKAAPRMAELLVQKNLVPDLIIASTAKRAQQTAELLIRTWDQVEMISDDSLYLAGPDAYLSAVASYAENQARVMVIGHNPGLEMLVDYLVGEAEFMPTAAVAVIPFQSDWQDIHTTELFEIFRPKELDS